MYIQQLTPSALYPHWLITRFRTSSGQDRARLIQCDTGIYLEFRVALDGRLTLVGSGR